MQIEVGALTYDGEGTFFLTVTIFDMDRTGRQRWLWPLSP